MNKQQQNKDDSLLKKQQVTSQKIISEEPYVVKLVKRLLIEAVEKRSSDILFEPLETTFRVRCRIDGLLCEMAKYPLQEAPYIVTAIKVISNLNVAEHRLPQDGNFSLEIDSRKVDFRVSVLPTNLGEKVVLRVLDRNKVKLDLDTLGFDDAAVKILKRNLKKPYGMILICGPTGSGKTTTLYSCIQFVNSVNVNIITVEDPVEFQIQGVNQVNVQESVGLTFAATLRAILRQDPNIILVGEIRDFETADIAVKASLTGHLVLTTLHTTTATAAIVRFINMGIDPFLVASSCLLSACQALIRILCPHCKQEIEPPKILLEELQNQKITIPSNFRYYKPTGCKLCNNIGYFGREGLIEIFEMDDQIREMLLNREPEIKIREVAIQKGMRTLRQKALEKVIEGKTTFEEVCRVTT